MPRQSQEPKSRNRRQKTKNRRRGNIALQGKPFEKRRTIGNHQPRAENQRQAHTDVNARSNRRVTEDVEPAVTGQVRTYQHAVLRSQDASDRSNPGLRRWLRDLDDDGRAWRAFIPRAVYGGHSVPIAVAGLYRRITNRRREQ